MTPETIELLLKETDSSCANCAAPLYRVVEIIRRSSGVKDSMVLGLTCRSCEANGMRLLKEN